MIRSKNLHTAGLSALTRRNSKPITVLGAGRAPTIGAEPSPAQAILIRVKNAEELARSQGAVASLATALAPATVGTKVLSTIADELKKALKEKNVQADIMVVDPAGWEPADGKFVQDIGYAVGGAGVLAGLWWLFTRRRGK